MEIFIVDQMLIFLTFATLLFFQLSYFLVSLLGQIYQISLTRLLTDDHDFKLTLKNEILWNPPNDKKLI